MRKCSHNLSDSRVNLDVNVVRISIKQTLNLRLSKHQHNQLIISLISREWEKNPRWLRWRWNDEKKSYVSEISYEKIQRANCVGRRNRNGWKSADQTDWITESWAFRAFTSFCDFWNNSAGKQHKKYLRKQLKNYRCLKINLMDAKRYANKRNSIREMAKPEISQSNLCA